MINNSRMMNSASCIFAALALISTATSKPYPGNFELTSGKFFETPEILTADPRYLELEKHVEQVVKKAVHNVTVETAKLMSSIINQIDSVYNGMREECKSSALDKLSQLKGSTLKGFGTCKEQKAIEERSWALAIHSSKLSGEIRRASEESLTFCMKKDNSISVVCRINPLDETSKRFDKLKTKVDEFSSNSTNIYEAFFVPFRDNCYSSEKFRDELDQIKKSCQ